MRICKKLWAHTLCAVFLLTGLTACSAPSTPSTPSNLTVAPDYTDGGAPSVKPGPQANSGEKGVIYTIPYAKWITESRMQDLHYHYDIMKLAVSLQGRLNALRPTLFVNDDKAYPQGDSRSASFFFDYMRRSEEDILYGYREQEIATTEEFLDIFRDEIVQAGLIVWDEQVPATANAAFTACGIDGYYPVRYDTAADSVYTLLTQQGASVKIDLHGKFTGSGTVWQTERASTGSAKNDAYIWAIEQYMDRCSSEYLGHLVDAAYVFCEGLAGPMQRYGAAGAQLADADFLIMKKAFFYDLFPLEQESPPDDPSQTPGTDYRTLCEILQKTYQKHGGSTFTQVIGLSEMTFKYGTEHLALTDPDFRYRDEALHQPGNWIFEYTTGQLLSSYNCVIDGDCGPYFSVFNCSIYAQHPLKDLYPNYNKPTELPTYDPNKIYIMYHMGDYDGAAWLTHRSVAFYKDSSRGELPLAWAFNPNLSKRIPVVVDYMRQYAGNNDYFIGGDSAAGYLYPSQLTQAGRAQWSGLGDATQAWIDWNKAFYEQFDLSITGFVHNGIQPLDKSLLSAYTAFSPDGASGWPMQVSDRFLVQDTLPFVGTFLGLTGDPLSGMCDVEQGAATIEQTIRDNPNLHFYFFRTVIVTPTSLLDITNRLKHTMPQVEVVDPYTFFGLAKQYMQSK